MKLTKKLASLALALLMICALSSNVFAVGEKGSITINSVHDDVIYEVYRMLDLKNYVPGSGTIDPITGLVTGGIYSYQVNADWAGFFTDYATAPEKDGLDYVIINENNYVEWKSGVGTDAATLNEFTALALAYAKANGIDPVQSSAPTGTPPAGTGDMVVTTSGGNTSGKFSNLDLGYYLVDSTMGALCGLTTTNPNASVNAKNGEPTVKKQVQEDSMIIDPETKGWGTENSADIGQIVNFEATITVQAGAENYTLHDEMSAGLTFRRITAIYHIVPGASTPTLVDKTSYYTVHTHDGTMLDELGNTVAVDGTCTDDCDFEVHFNEAFCKHIKPNTKVTIYYEAMVNRNAVIAGTGNTNSAYVSYGENQESEPGTTKTYTYAFDLIKTDGENTLIDGAQFRIYDAATGGNEVPVIVLEGTKILETDPNFDTKVLKDEHDQPIKFQQSDDPTDFVYYSEITTYRHARADEAAYSHPIVVCNGQVRLKGFDNGTYYLEETKAPLGYNMLAAREEFTISSSNLDATFNSGIYSTGSGVHVVNKSGSMLPETGGIGTTIFYISGAALALGAVVLLITKKRMGSGE